MCLHSRTKVHTCSLVNANIYLFIFGPKSSNSVSPLFSWKSELFFVYDYIPGAVTFYDQYLLNPTRSPSESILWSFACQLLNALRKIHSAGLTCFGAIDATKILITPGKRKVQLNCVGMYDLFIGQREQEQQKEFATYQRDDLMSVGRVILSLIMKTDIHEKSDVDTCLGQLSSTYSPQLLDMLRYMLLDEETDEMQSQSKNVATLCSRFADRFMDEMSHMHEQYDALESELSKELENGRLFRLLVKIQFVNERLSHEELSGSGWSETGDKYILNLFKDYLFYQTTEDGVPLIDMGHVIETLNKLDAGLDEKILLMSRDEQNLLVVSFRDLKNAISKTFTELFTMD